VRRPKGKRRAQLQMLQALSGVGPERAKRLLDEFGSVESVLAASMDDLRTVDGIGLTTAEAIRWVVSEKPAHYGCTAPLSGEAKNGRGRFIESDYSS
jgi:ERCC4-type nuclease